MGYLGLGGSRRHSALLRQECWGMLLKRQDPAE
jgi:hypothetical protein